MSTSDDAARLIDGLQQQAWTWLRHLHSGDVRPWDVQGFERWLQSSPAHQAAFEAASRQWALFKPVAGAVLRRNTDASARPERTLQGSPVRSRRVFLGTAATAAAALVAGVAILRPPEELWPAPAEWGADYRTRTGEQREIDLADRVRVTLNTRTSIRRRAAGLGIDLLTGEAAVDLPPPSAAARAVIVVAGAGRSVAQAGGFEVRHLDSTACVTCLEGTVRLEHPRGIRNLTTGQQVIYNDSTLGPVVDVDPLQVSAWRKGELVFNKTRLADVIEEINRYRPGRVVLMKSSVRDEPVSGSFYIASLDQALRVLARTFDLKTHALPAGLLILA